MLWRFSANNTHLYPGALLRALDRAEGATLAAGDGCLVEFSDGVCASGRLQSVTPALAVLQLAAYRTARGAAVAARTWGLGPDGAEGRVRVHRRLPGSPTD